MAFGGESHTFVEWKAALLLYLHATVDKLIDIWAKWGPTQKDEVTEDASEFEYGDEFEQTTVFVEMPFGARGMVCLNSVSYVQLRIGGKWT